MTETPNPYELPPQRPDPFVESTTDVRLEPNNDDRNLAALAHLSGVAGIVTGGFLGFVGPLIIYLLKRESSPYVEFQAKEALNFQITLLIIAAACIVLAIASCGTLFFVAFVPMVLQLVFGIIAALATRDGQPYRYPFNLRLIR